MLFVLFTVSVFALTLPKKCEQSCCHLSKIKAVTSDCAGSQNSALQWPAASTQKQGREAPEGPRCALNRPASWSTVSTGNGWQTAVPGFATRVLVFGGHFSQMKWACHYRKMTNSIYWQWWNKLLKWRLESWKTSATGLSQLPDPDGFSDSATNEHGCVSFFSNNYMTKSFNILEDLYSPLTSIFQVTNPGFYKIMHG